MHETHIELTGTFPGHVIPGVLLVFWGLWWFWFVVRDQLGEAPPRGAIGPAGPAQWPVRTTYAHAETGFKLVVPVAAAVGDLWWASWRLTDTSVLNYQHATAYLGFFLAGLVDLLVRAGRVPGYVAHLALAGAFANAGLQFMAHGNHLPVSDAVHVIVTWLFLLQAAVLLIELRYRHPALSLARAYGLVVQGTWFLHAAWMLYRLGWDLTSPYNLMRVHLFFTWHLLGVLVGLALLHALAFRWAGPPAPHGAAPHTEGAAP